MMEKRSRDWNVPITAAIVFQRSQSWERVDSFFVDFFICLGDRVRLLVLDIPYLDRLFQIQAQINDLAHQVNPK